MNNKYHEKIFLSISVSKSGVEKHLTNVKQVEGKSDGWNGQKQQVFSIQW